MSLRNERLEGRARNVSVSAPASWHPDGATMMALAYLSQQVLTRMHLNFGRAKIALIEDATAGSDQLVVRTRGKLWTQSADILVHPKLASLVVSPRVPDTVANFVASSAAVTRYILLHPFSAEEQQQEFQNKARSVAMEIVSAENKRQGRDYVRS